MKCRFGLHRWTLWHSVPVYDVDESKTFLGQIRRCERCGIEKIRQA